MHLLSLPGELLVAIVELSTARDGYSLALTCSQLYDLLLPALYRLSLRRDRGYALFWAAEHDQLGLAMKLLRCRNFDINITNNRSAPFILAAQAGSESVFDLLLTRPDLDVNLQVNGRSALWAAACSGRTSIVERLVHLHDTRVDDVGRSKCIPFMASIIWGNLQSAILLYRTGHVDIDRAGEGGMTPLMFAIERRDEEMANFLLSRNEICTTTQDDNGRTPLMWAVRVGVPTVVRKLAIQAQSTISTPDIDNRSPLWVATNNGFLEIALDLLRAGANVNMSDNSGRTPLMLSIAKPMAQLCLDWGANADAVDSDGKTSLHLAVDNGSEGIIPVLLRHQRNINLQDYSGQTPLCNAIMKGRVAVVRLLLADDRLDVNLEVNDMPPFHHAISARHTMISRILCQTTRFDPNRTDSGGRTSLSMAILYREMDVLDILLKRGDAEINPSIIGVQPPLWAAIEEQNRPAVQRLIRCKGLDMDTGFDASPVMQAVAWGCHDILQDLLIAGADVNSTDSAHFNGLLIAASKGDTDSLAILLKQKDIDVNAQSLNGHTALWCAAQGGHVGVFEQLLHDPRTIKEFNYHREDFARVMREDAAIYALTLGTCLETLGFDHQRDSALYYLDC